MKMYITVLAMEKDGVRQRGAEAGLYLPSVFVCVGAHGTSLRTPMLIVNLHVTHSHFS